MCHTAINLQSLFKYQHRFRFETTERKRESERLGVANRIFEGNKGKRALYYLVKVLSFLKNKGSER